MCITNKLGIKRCKCGGKAEYIECDISNNVMVYCLKCADRVLGSKLQEAVKLWNERNARS